jgi:hypothetical protein
MIRNQKAFIFHFIIVLLPPVFVCTLICLFTETIDFSGLLIYLLCLTNGLKIFFISLIVYLTPISMSFFIIIIISIWICTSYFFYVIEVKGYRKISRIISLFFVISNIIAGIVFIYISSMY